MPTTFLLADDHDLVRLGFRALLEKEPNFQLVGETGDGKEVLRLTEKLRPDVLILDLMMPRMNGLEVARHLRGRPYCPIIIIQSIYDDPTYATEALRTGASAYVAKGAGAQELLRAIRQAIAGKHHPGAALSLNNGEANGKGSKPKQVDPFQSLSFREREVLELTAQGHSSNEIAQFLFISPRTVESHRANLLNKLGLRNLKELVRYAVQRTLVHGGNEPTQALTR